MTTAPTLTFVPSGLTDTDFIKNRFTVDLWANDDVFKTYYDWATPVGAPSNTYQRNAAETYSGYVLRFNCNIAGTTIPNGSGCCLQDASG